MIASFMKNYPREVMYSKRRFLVQTREEFLQRFREAAPRTDFYQTIYSFKEVEVKERECNGRIFARPSVKYSTANVNKVFWDIDHESCWEDLQKLHRWCRWHDVLHTVVFSGGGYHLFMLTVPTNKVAVRNFQLYLTNKLKLNLDDRHKRFFGDTARVSRVPGTFNFKQQRWCICLQASEIKLSYEKHYELASENREKGYDFVGKYLLDLSDYGTDSYSISINVPKINIPDGELGIINNIDVSNCEPCIRALIMRKQREWIRQNGYIERRVLITYARERLGLTLNQCIEFMRRILTPAEFRHMNEEVPNYPGGQVGYIYQRGDIFFPTCYTLKTWGLCTGGDCDKNQDKVR